ncbi:unnamed protein product [Cylicocyclus nassatus]|uniref:Uncharacterized protein n=1 Tax=Cylicocyclus nassatus TaxID=53992 RepID=A0AA36MDW9_CYLNA|nr:unnamed protein product [Cylicocyclus nassatus]
MAAVMVFFGFAITFIFCAEFFIILREATKASADGEYAIKSIKALAKITFTSTKATGLEKFAVKKND